MAAETPTGEAPTALDLALRMRDRLHGLAKMVEHTHTSAGALDDAGDGLVQLLQDAAEAAGELLETIRSENLASIAAKKTGGEQ
ncbi:MAG: hypothetical protein ACR652_05330 [Methylocystis sp.]|uniref:hypothetical protein n=1 Tax=Methylocystis sp. TaxID=1911079 RepID=UPI003DA26ACE